MNSLLPVGSSKIKSVLIVRIGALGDIVLSTPVIRAVRKHFPQSKIHYLADINYKETLANNPYLDGIVFIERDKMKSKFFGRWKEEIAFYRLLRDKKFDLVIDLVGTPRSAWMTLFSKASYRLGPSYHVRKYVYNYLFDTNKQYYVADYNLELLSGIGIKETDHKLDFFVSEEEQIFAQDFIKNHGLENKKIIGLNPGGTWVSKQWPNERWIEIIRYLQNTDMVPVIIASAREKLIVETIMASLEKPVTLISNLSLGKVAALISKMKLLVTNDSGLRYVTVALEIPTIALFGPTDPVNASPPDGPHKVIYKNFDCAPCNKLFCKTKKCMYDITVNDVLKEMKELI